MSDLYYHPVLDGTFEEMFPESRMFKVGDVVIPHPMSSVYHDEKYLKTKALTGKEHLTVVGLKSDLWLQFDELPMRYTTDGGVNSWNPRFWIPYQPKKHLPEDLFEL